MTEHQQDANWNVAEWHGKMLVDRDGERIGKLQDVYVDVENDEPQFATVKEGFIGRHLTFVPLGGITVGPDDLRVAVTRSRSGPRRTSHSTARSSRRQTSRRSITTTSSTTRHPKPRADADSLAADASPSTTDQPQPPAPALNYAYVHQASGRPASPGSARPPALRLVQGQGLWPTPHQPGPDARAPTSLRGGRSTSPLRRGSGTARSHCGRHPTGCGLTRNGDAVYARPRPSWMRSRAGHTRYENVYTADWQPCWFRRGRSPVPRGAVNVQHVGSPNAQERVNTSAPAPVCVNPTGAGPQWRAGLALALLIHSRTCLHVTNGIPVPSVAHLPCAGAGLQGGAHPAAGSCSGVVERGRGHRRVRGIHGANAQRGIPPPGERVKLLRQQ